MNVLLKSFRQPTVNRQSSVVRSFLSREPQNLEKKKCIIEKKKVRRDSGTERADRKVEKKVRNGGKSTGNRKQMNTQTSRPEQILERGVILSYLDARASPGLLSSLLSFSLVLDLYLFLSFSLFHYDSNGCIKSLSPIAFPYINSVCYTHTYTSTSLTKLKKKKRTCKLVIPERKTITGGCSDPARSRTAL